MKTPTAFGFTSPRFSIMPATLLLAALFLQPVRSRATTTIATNTVIGATNLNFDGQDIVIDGCLVTISGPHSFNSVAVSNGATLTPDLTTSNQVNSLLLTINNGLIVDATSRIDVTGRGYTTGYTTGNTTNGGSYSDAGGSYGGLGWAAGPGIANSPYGDYHNPTEPGSGSGNYYAGVSGGGLIRIAAGSALINGSIIANGSNSVYVGGSGGGIYLNVVTLSGSGTISANGGAGTNYGAGGGGRVAIYYVNVNGFNLSSNVTAHGGFSRSDQNGSVGTVFLQQSGQPGQLLISSHGTPVALWTPLGLAGDTSFEADTLEVSGTNVIAAPEHQMPIAVDTLLVENGGTVTHLPTTTNVVYSLDLTVTNTLNVDAQSKIDVSGRGYLGGYTVGNLTNRAASGVGGGSYGGLGANSGSSFANAVYGDYHFPNYPGSGAGISGGIAIAGGGLAQISAAIAQIDGAILANGSNGGFSGGSGGGIYLNVGTLAGSGFISANGGNGADYCGGGGGRVAVVYGTNNGFILGSNITTHAGIAPHTNDGSLGTVYLQEVGQTDVLLIATHGTPAALWTPLGQDSDTNLQVGALEIIGTNAVVAPEHQMPVSVGKVLVLQGAVLTHQPTTTNQVYSLVLSATNNVIVDASSKIDVSGRGYLGGYTIGNSTNGAASGEAGGSYGGLGASLGTSIANAAYGDYHFPNYPGSGAGNSGGIAVAGGGLAQITAAIAQIDGAILANGSNGGFSGASGGGIYLNVGMLTGAGIIDANGGNGQNYFGGGGGRIAIIYGTTNGFNLFGNVAVSAGNGTLARDGSVGSLFFQQSGQPGQLVITAHGMASSLWTPLGNTNDTVFQVDSLVLSGSNIVAVTAGGAPISANNVSLVNGATLSHLPTTPTQVFSLDLSVAGTLSVDATSSINVSGCGYQAGYTTGNSILGGAGDAAGGSYGGLGAGNSGSIPNYTYGDYRNPTEPGAGSGTFVQGVPGGGLARISATLAEIEGSILANGSNGGLGGGSGGGIYLNVGTLSGSGRIAADGGNAAAYFSGGGGRVAIYYGATNGFNLYSNVTVDPGIGNAGTGAPGTIFLKQTGQLGQLYVLTSLGTNVGAWTPLGQATDTVFQADTLIVKGSNVVAAPAYPIPIDAGSITVEDGGNLTHPFTTPQTEYSLRVNVTNTLFIDAKSRIDVSGRGYPSDFTLGDVMMPSNMMYNGGSYGGLGSIVGGGITPTPTYGDPHDPSNLGSGSGLFSGGAAGGGLVQITAGVIQDDGQILANGHAGIDSGSGGGILLNAGILSGSGRISANGGVATGTDLNHAGGNAGGGGRIAVYTWESLSLPTTNIVANGGTGTNAGQAGTVVISSTPWPSFNNVLAYWHGVSSPFSWSSLGIGPNSTYQAELSISASGTVVFDEAVPTTGSLTWDSTAVSNGTFTATLTLFRGTKAIGQATQNGVVNNSVSWHEGTLTNSQTWSSGVVNAVDQTVVIPSGVTLTIAPGAIVKFAPGTTIVVETGGILNTLGTNTAPIVFTSIYDDSVGGDTDLDGGRTQPQPGDWAGIEVVGGQFIENSFVSILFTEQFVGGQLSSTLSLLGNSVYVVNKAVVVPTGVTLTINPGAVLKFGAGTSITVNSGGTLNAIGSRSQPIVLTSVNDDTAGGNTGGAGSASAPQPGDWVSIYVSGKATFVNTFIRYGGATGTGAAASGEIIAQAGQLMLSNCVVEDTLYDGVSFYDGATGTIVNSVLRNTDRAVWAYQAGTTVNVINCTFDQNVAGVDQHSSATLNVENSIIANSIQGSSPDFVVNFSHCDLWSSYTNSTNPNGVIGQNGNFSADPKFVNEANQDFRLNYGSPCIDAADGALSPLTDILGDGRYNDPRTSPKTGVANSQGNYPDVGAYEFVETAPSDVDLVVASVDGPASIQANSTVTLQWADENIGTGNATGPWYDSVSLVLQSDPSVVIPVGNALVAQGFTLGPSQTYNASASFRVPGGIEGNYLVQVQVNSRGDVFEGPTWTNNTSISATPTSLIVLILPIGATITGNFTAPDQADLYKVIPTSGQDAQVMLQTTAVSNALQLFIAQGYVPGPTAFDLESGQFDSTIATLSIANPNGGVYYVSAYPQALLGSSINYSLSATEPTSVSLSSVGPTQLPGTGTATVQITGSLLSSSDKYELVGPGGTIVATSVTVPDSTTAYATFTLNGASIGNYNLEVIAPGSSPVITTNAITITKSTGTSSFWAQLQLPSQYRQGRPFSGTIVYGNNGDADMKAPILILGAGGVAELELSTNGFSTNDLYLIAASMQGPAGVLRAGESWSIPFTALSGTTATIPFSLSYKLADSTNIVDYTALSTTERPLGYTDAEWTALWNAFQAQAGPTWGGLISLLDNYSTEMAEEDADGQAVGTFYLESGVFQYALSDIYAQMQTSVSGTLYLENTNQPVAFTEIYINGATTNQVGAAESALDGTFRFVNIPNGVYSISVPGYWIPTPLQLTYTNAGVEIGVAIIVEAGGTFAGTIQNQNGTLFLTNVAVEAISTTTNGVYTTASGSDGTYVLSGLPPDIYYLMAGGSNYAVQTIDNLTVINGQTLPENFFLGLAASLTGVVMGDGSSLTNGIVALTDSSGDISGGVTDTNGAFTVSGLQSGVYTVEVEAAGYAPIAMTINLTPGATSSLGTVTLVPGATITAMVDTSSSQPITNSLVTVMQNGTIIEQLFTSSNGSAVLPNLAAGTYQVITTAYGYQNVTNTVTVAAGASASTTMTASLLGTVSGQVTDGAGNPIPGIEVNVLGSHAQFAGFLEWAITDTNGDYSIAGLAAGSYVVSVGNNTGVDEKPLTIPVSLASQTVNFKLDGAVVQGSLFNSGGTSPVPYATVVLTQSNQLLATATTDTNGLYVFQILLPGGYELQASSLQGISSNIAIAVPASGNLAAPALTLGGYQLTVTVTDQASNPISNSIVAAIPTNGAPLATFSGLTSVNGSASMTGLIPGQYVLEIQQSGFAPVKKSVNILGNTNLVIALSPGTPVSGVITDAASGAGVSNATIGFFDSASHYLMAITNTDASGNYSAIQLAAGTYDVLVVATNYQIQDIASVEVGANLLVFNAVMSATNTVLQGTATDTSGNPIAGVIIFINDSVGETPVILVAGNDGSWATSQLAPGNYTLKMQALGYLPPSEGTISIAAGTPQTANLLFTPIATDNFRYNTGQFFYTLSQGIANAFSAIPCVQPLDEDKYTRNHNFTQPLCSCAYTATLALRKAYDQALFQMHVAYQQWDQAAQDGKAVAGANIAVTSIHAAQTALDTVASFTGFNEVDQALVDVLTASKAGKGVIAASQITTAIIAIRQATMDALNATDTQSSVQSFVETMYAYGYNAQNLANLVNILKNNSPGWTPGSPSGVLFDALGNAADLITTWDNWNQSAGICVQAQDSFNIAYKTYELAWENYENAVQAANNDCGNCVPPPPPPPPNPNPVNPDPNPVPPGNSHDPNDKSTTGFGVPAWVQLGGIITYTILFENATNASLPAQMVTISDTLSSNLDLSSLALGTIGFNNVTVPVQPGAQALASSTSVPTDPNPVEVDAGLDPTNGVLTWLMESINPATDQLVTDPLAGFLPPDNARQSGEGYVTYTVRTRPGLPTGAQILNTASIVFDVNAPIPTPVVTNTIDGTPPVSSMTVLPPTVTPTNLLVSWSGSDVGSGVADYSIYVSVNDRPWTVWLQGVTNNSATYTVVGGNSYAFYSVATDEVGNQETAPKIPGAITSVISIQPLLASPVFSDHLFEFNVSAATGSNYVIQASTNLENWIPIGTNVAPFLFMDSNSIEYPLRWYRAVLKR